MNLPCLSQLSIAASLLVLSACSSLPVAPKADAIQHAQTVQASWVVLGPQGQAVARVITNDAVCPALIQDGVATTMQVRAPAETIAQRKTASKPEDSKPSAFPVLTCEAPLAATTKVATVAGQNLALPKAAAQKIIVIGDTGCRMKMADNYFQSCNDSEKWAFREMVNAAAKLHPDLVIHVGDYHYRENACPEGNKECAGSPWGYGWDTWKADFFDPAKALLNAAPWVVVRGNHETCVRAGQGWWRFMDPRPLEAGRDCNRAENDDKGDYSAPYGVPVGRIGDQLAQFIVFDSSKVPNKVLAKTDAAYQTYLEQFRQVDRLAAQADFNFFINHHPILGFGVQKTASGELQTWPGNLALQDVMMSSHPVRLFPEKVQATLSGHVHLFEALTFTTGQPTQFVSGNGGSSLDTPLPLPLKPGSTPLAGAQLDFFSNSNDVGFMTMERDAQTWKIQAWNRHGKLLTTCRMQEGKTQCESAM